MGTFLGFLIIRGFPIPMVTIMENQMEKNMENEMETGVIWGIL